MQQQKFGTVTYKYATAASDGTAYRAPSDESAYTDAIPVNAGIYAVKLILQRQRTMQDLQVIRSYLQLTKQLHRTLVMRKRVIRMYAVE